MRYTRENNPTTFGRILRGELPCHTVYEDEYCIVILPLEKLAHHHFLIIPRDHMTGLHEATEADKALLGHLTCIAPVVAAEQGFLAEGFHLHTNAIQGQTVEHLHFHLTSDVDSPILRRFA